MTKLASQHTHTIKMSPELVRRLRNAAAQYRMSQAQLISGMLKLAEKYPDDLEDMASKEENNSAVRNSAR